MGDLSLFSVIYYRVKSPSLASLSLCSTLASWKRIKMNEIVRRVVFIWQSNAREWEKTKLKKLLLNGKKKSRKQLKTTHLWPNYSKYSVTAAKDGMVVIEGVFALYSSRWFFHYFHCLEIYIHFIFPLIFRTNWLR